jgi:hypothetical protein
MHPVHTTVIGDYGLGAYDGITVRDARGDALVVADRVINGRHYGSKIRIPAQENRRWYEFPQCLPLRNNDGFVAENFEQQPIALHNL